MPRLVIPEALSLVLKVDILITVEVDEDPNNDEENNTTTDEGTFVLAILGLHSDLPHEPMSINRLYLAREEKIILECF